MSYDLSIFDRPNVYEPGTITLWSTPYIGANVLKIHLDNNIDSGSRKKQTRNECIRWLTGLMPSGRKAIDIGCGPGLYTYELCKRGWNVDGIDISPYQIEYAKNHNSIDGYSHYLVCDFREYDFRGNYDLALMMYGIYSFYSPSERLRVLKRLRNSMSNRGCVVAEVFTDKHYEHRAEETDWSIITENGLWKKGKYLELNAFRRYDSEHVVLIQAGILADSCDVWNSWIQLFDADTLIKEFKTAGFTKFELFGSCKGDELKPDSEVICICASQ